MKGTRAVAQRIVNAEERFMTYAMDRGFTRAEAEKIFNVYISKKVRAIKIDAVGGQFRFTHGAFGDVETMRLALAQGKS